MSEQVKPPDTIWLQYCKDGSLGQFWWTGGDAEYIRRNSANHCTPEERAVIDAALYWRYIYADVFSFESDDRPQGLTDAETLLEQSIDALLATRSKEVSK